MIEKGFSMKKSNILERGMKEMAVATRFNPFMSFCLEPISFKKTAKTSTTVSLVNLPSQFTISTEYGDHQSYYANIGVPRGRYPWKPEYRSGKRISLDK